MKAMADPQISRSFCRNPLFGGKNKLAGGAPTEGSNTHTFIPAVLHVFTSALALVPPSINELFQ